MTEQEKNSKMEKMTLKELEDLYETYLEGLEANFNGVPNYKIFMKNTILCLKILGMIEKRSNKSESEVEHDEALRSSEESSSADA